MEMDSISVCHILWPSVLQTIPVFGLWMFAPLEPSILQSPAPPFERDSIFVSAAVKMNTDNLPTVILISSTDSVTKRIRTAPEQIIDPSTLRRGPGWSTKFLTHFTFFHRRRAVRLSFQFPKAATYTVDIELDQVAGAARCHGDVEKQFPVTDVVNSELVQDPLRSSSTRVPVGAHPED